MQQIPILDIRQLFGRRETDSGSIVSGKMSTGINILTTKHMVLA